MLYSAPLVLRSSRIPPIGGAVVDQPLDILDFQLLNGLESIDAAAAVGVYGIQRLRQQNKGRPGAADGPQLFRHPGGVGEHRHNAGDAPLRLRFNVQIRLFQTELGTGAVIVADHGGQRPEGIPLFHIIQTG